MKDRLVGLHRNVIASRGVGHCLMHPNLEAMCQFLPCLRLNQPVRIREFLSTTFFESDHFSQEDVHEIISCHVLATWDENATLQKLVDQSH